MSIVSRPYRKWIALVTSILGLGIVFFAFFISFFAFVVETADYDVIPIIVVIFLFGCFVIYKSIVEAWEITVTEDGIGLRNIITRIVRLIKYDDIQKIKRQRYSSQGPRNRPSQRIYFQQLEITLKSGELIVLKESLLKNIVKTHEYIRDKVSNALENVEITS